jgi:hypothetical protein
MSPFRHLKLKVCLQSSVFLKEEIGIFFDLFFKLPKESDKSLFLRNINAHLLHVYLISLSTFIYPVVFIRLFHANVKGNRIYRNFAL